MTAAVKHLYLAPVKAATLQQKFEVTTQNSCSETPLVMMKTAVAGTGNNFKLVLPTGNGVYYFSPHEIIRLEAKNNCTKFFFTSHTSLLICKTLKEYDTVLRKYGFLRIHKSYLVNKNFITCCTNTGTAMLKDNSTVAVSRRRRKEIMDLLKG
jgi:two-component system, LytTR family, response regulator